MTTIRRILIKQDLLFIMLFSLLLAAVIALGDRSYLQYVRVLLGLPFLLLFPGYALIAVLFPRKSDLGGIELVALCLGLSITVVPLIGLGLNYTPLGIGLVPMLVTLIIFNFTMSGFALYRRGNIPIDERFILGFNLPALDEFTHIDRVLVIIMVITVLFAIGSIVYAAATPKTGEKFTEFYVLGPGGKAEGYPTALTVGEKAQVLLGVVNHEYSPITYNIQVKIGDTISTVGPIALNNEQKWEHPVDISADKPYDNVQVEFLLYKMGDTVPYRSLHLWVTIKASQGVAVP